MILRSAIHFVLGTITLTLTLVLFGITPGYRDYFLPFYVIGLLSAGSFYYCCRRYFVLSITDDENRESKKSVQGRKTEDNDWS